MYSKLVYLLTVLIFVLLGTVACGTDSSIEDSQEKSVTAATTVAVASANQQDATRTPIPTFTPTQTPQPQPTPTPTPTPLDFPGVFSKMLENFLTLTSLYVDNCSLCFILVGDGFVSVGEESNPSSSQWLDGVVQEKRTLDSTLNELLSMKPPPEYVPYELDFALFGTACPQMFELFERMVTPGYVINYEELSGATGFVDWCMYYTSKIRGIMDDPAATFPSLPVLNESEYSASAYPGSDAIYQTKNFAISFPLHVERRETIISAKSEEEAKGIYYVVPIRVTNTSKVRRNFMLDGPNICIVNPWEIMGGCIIADVMATSAFYELQTVRSWIDANIGEIPSGQSVDDWLVFDVPEDLPITLLKITAIHRFDSASDYKVIATLPLVDASAAKAAEKPSNGVAMPTGNNAPNPSATQETQSSGTTQVSTEASSTVIVKITGELANVRSGPGTEHAQVGQASQGQQFTLVGRNDSGDWYQICCFGDSPAWVAAFLVEVYGDIQLIPTRP